MYKPVKTKSSGAGFAIGFPFAVIAVTAMWALFAVGGCDIQVSGFNFRGVTATTTDEGDVAADVNSIEITHMHGDVVVKQSDQLGWSWRLKTWADTQEMAESFCDQIKLDVQEAGQDQKWELVFPEDMNECNGVESILTINVPNGVTAKINNRHGESMVSGIDGLSITSQHGNLDLSSLTKNTIIDNRHGDIKIENFAGAEIDNAHGDIVAGKSTGSITVTTRHGDFSVSDVDGDLSVDSAHGDLVAAISGDLDAELKHGDMEIKCNGEILNCENSHGDISIKATNTSVKKVDIHGSHSEVDLWLPASLSPDFSTGASHGDVHNEFGSSGSGGPTVNVKTSFDDVNIHKM